MQAGIRSSWSLITTVVSNSSGLANIILKQNGSQERKPLTRETFRYLIKQIQFINTRLGVQSCAIFNDLLNVLISRPKAAVEFNQTNDGLVIRTMLGADLALWDTSGPVESPGGQNLASTTP